MALNTVRETVNALFASCVEELGADPAAEDLFKAVGAALELQAPQRKQRGTTRTAYGWQADAGPGSTSDLRVRTFWREHRDRFPWDFLPTAFLYPLYRHWFASRFPREVELSQMVFARVLKPVATAGGSWIYTRSRPGCLMDAAEPLTGQALGWEHDGSDHAIYGLRRRGA